MIYDVWGDKVEIIARCGEHKPFYLNYPSQLIRVRTEEGDIKYHFVHTLKSDGGINEIVKILLDIPFVELSPVQLKNALRQAQ